MADPAEVQAALFSWEEGARRMRDRAGDGLGRTRARLMGACMDEIRRRMGMTFTVSQLVDDYREAAVWFLPLAQGTAPRHPEAWDPAVVLDAAYAEFRRQASDATWAGR